MLNMITVTGFVSSEIRTTNTKNGNEVHTFFLSSKSKEKYITYKVCLWGKRFDSLLQYLEKNKAILVIGDFELPTHYMDRNEEIRINLTINAQKIDLLPTSRSKSNEEDEPLPAVLAEVQPTQQQQEAPRDMEPELDF